jgi:hypothetical protein
MLLTVQVSVWELEEKGRVLSVGDQVQFSDRSQRQVTVLRSAALRPAEDAKKQRIQRLVQGSAVSSVLATWSGQPIVTGDNRRWRPTIDHEYSLVT